MIVLPHEYARVELGDIPDRFLNPHPTNSIGITRIIIFFDFSEMVS